MGQLFVPEPTDDFFDAQLRRTDSLTTQLDKRGRTLDMSGQLIHVHVIAFEQLQDTEWTRNTTALRARDGDPFMKTW